ncbi:MAG: non-hydrolyzing UDP-N-acetylglucosamine 2-epimerase [Candidatus Sumerlaeia bacterium]
MSKPRIMTVFGTRPEAIKLAPVVHELRKRMDRIEPVVCVTGQHRQMLDQVLGVFDIEPDVDLNLMTFNQSLADLTALILKSMNEVFEQHQPDCILVQGDTTTVMAASICAFYHKIKVGHVEAGLRTDNKYSPFPEEINRRLASQVADFHFAPTSRSRENLLREGFSDANIVVTGNTVIDALLMARDKAHQARPMWDRLNPKDFEGRPVVAITGHRRESFGEGFQSLCRAIKRLASEFSDIAFIYPVHLNPQVRGPVFDLLSNLNNVYLIEPLEYLPFVSLMEKSLILISDSGGVQEEAPALGKPVLVTRDTTERPEAVESGVAMLVGTDEERIVGEASRLLRDKAAREEMGRIRNPFGDGTAAVQIMDWLEQRLKN